MRDFDKVQAGRDAVRELECIRGAENPFPPGSDEAWGWDDELEEAWCRLSDAAASESW